MTPTRAFLCAAAACLLFALPLHAQALRPGQWKGHMYSPARQLVDVTLTVQPARDALEATLTTALGEFTLSGVEDGSNGFSFIWNPGFEMECRLLEDDAGRYQGACKDYRGRIGPVLLAPPGRAVTPDDFDLDAAFAVWGTRPEPEPEAPAPEPPPPPPVGAPVDLGGRALSMYEAGSGPVTVVFESDVGDLLEGWAEVLRALAPDARVVAYDRAGLGASTPAETRGPRTPDAIADDLYAMLEQAGLAPPFVLVGHRAGGLYVRRFAERYPDAVAGLVLVDPIHEAEATRLRALDAGSYDAYRKGQEGLHRLAPPAVQREHEGVRAVLDAGTFGGETLPAVPLVVLTAHRTVEAPRWVGETAQGQEARRALHAALADAWPQGIHRVVEAPGSYLHQVAPEAVVEAIRQVLETAEAAPAQDY